MGATALLLKLNREKAAEEGRQKGRQQGIEETIQFLERSGKGDVAQFLRRERANGWDGDRR